MLHPPPLRGFDHLVVIRGRSDEPFAEESHDPKIHGDCLTEILHVDVGHHVSFGVLRFHIHEMDDVFDAIETAGSDTSQIEDCVPCEDLT